MDYVTNFVHTEWDINICKGDLKSGETKYTDILKRDNQTGCFSPWQRMFTYHIERSSSSLH